MRLKQMMIAALMIVAVMVAALPAGAQSLGELSAVIVECRVEISFLMPEPLELDSVTLNSQSATMAKRDTHMRGAMGITNTVYVQIWDDGTFLESIEVTGEVGSSQTVFYQISQYYVGEEIGIYLMTTSDGSGSQYSEIDPFFISDEVVDSCLETATAACPFPLPAGSVIYSIPQGAPAFFAADLSAGTGFNVKAGTWYISEFEGDFALVWIACQARPVWVPTNAVAR